MSSAGQLLAWCREASRSILQLPEIEEWFEENQLEGGRPLQELLRELVGNGSLGCRTVAVGDDCYTVYWLKNEAENPPAPATIRTPSQLQKSGTPMSSSLRERLKRSRPRFISPLLSSTKRPCMADSKVPIGKLDFSECVQGTSGKGEQATEVRGGHGSQGESLASNSGGPGRSDSGEGCSGEQVRLLLAERASLRAELEEKREKLRKLRMVKMYRTKADLCDLASLVGKWREVSQEAAERLLSLSTLHPPPSMADLLRHLHIDPATIHYDPREETFF